MYCTSMIFFLHLLTLSFAVSSGAAVCDALGMCAVTSSGAYNDTDAGTIRCPWGMHLVAPPVRSDAYLVATADVGEQGPTEYIPGELLDVHIRVLNPMKKFLGILIYAVQNDGVLGVEGCPSPGCDGKAEVKVGSWEEDANPLFRTGCGGQTLTHTDATFKNYHHIFRWRAPPAGSGDVIFRVVVKQGSTNGGYFHWPMTTGDLMLYEGTAEEKATWYAGPNHQTCSQICANQGWKCERSVVLNGTLDLYDRFKHSLSCQTPLISSCSRAPTRDSEGFCFLQNLDSGLCSKMETPSNICDTDATSPDEERLCPCSSEPVEEDAFLLASDSSSVIIIGVVIVAVVACCAIVGTYVYRQTFKGNKDSVVFDPELGPEVVLSPKKPPAPTRPPTLPPRRLPRAPSIHKAPSYPPAPAPECVPFSPAQGKSRVAQLRAQYEIRQKEGHMSPTTGYMEDVWSQT